jgi:hypothetical protein
LRGKRITQVLTVGLIPRHLVNIGDVFLSGRTSLLFTDLRNFESGVLQKMDPTKTPFQGLLAFANTEVPKEYDHSLGKYLAYAGFDPEQVKKWGRIGSLMDALNTVEDGDCHGSELGESFLDFLQNLPPGNSPRPIIRHRMQRSPNA